MKKGLLISVALAIASFANIGYAGLDVTVTAKDRKMVTVTVYNNSMALVRDIRTVELEKGNGTLRFEGVAEKIRPVTVYIKSIGQQNKFTVLEQHYEFDLSDRQKLLDKYVGKKIKIIDQSKYQDKKVVVEALLLSNTNGSIFKIGNEIYLEHPGIKVLPELKGNFTITPSLVWTYINKSEGPHTIEVSYLTDGITWKADYVFIVGDDESSADFTGWITIDNKSGTEFKNARLKLVAWNSMKDSDSLNEEAFSEYRPYMLPGRITIEHNQAKQLLLGTCNVKTKKVLVVKSAQNKFTEHNDIWNNETVNLYMLFRNSKANNLGKPLPGGTVCVYKKDIDETQVFLGKDRVEHISQREEVKLKIAIVSDVKVVRKQTDYVRVSSKVHESEWEMYLTNNKKRDVKVKVLETLQGKWEIIEKSHSFKKMGQNNVVFDIDVPDGEKVKLRYRVKVEL